MDKRTNKRSTTWSPGDVDVLLKLWALKVNDLRQFGKAHLVHCQISAELKKTGRMFGAKEVSTKIQNLSSKYRKLKKEANCSGDLPSWPLYQKIHNIMQNYNDGKTSEKTFNESSMRSNNDCLEPSSSTEFLVVYDEAPLPEEYEFSNKPVKRRKTVKATDSALQKYKNSHRSGIAGKLDVEMLNIERERNEILKEFVTSVKCFGDDLTEALRK